jgi:hypothetical protein
MYMGVVRFINLKKKQFSPWVTTSTTHHDSSSLLLQSENLYTIENIMHIRFGINVSQKRNGKEYNSVAMQIKSSHITNGLGL